MEYKCYKCFYKTDRKCNFLTHLKRKIKCSRNVKSSYTDEEINELNNKQILKDVENIVIDNFAKTFSCKFCNKIFNRKYNCNRHIGLEHIDEDENIDTKNIKNNNIIETVINNNNITNIQNIQNIQNNINISLKIPDLIPFEEEWDLSEINNNDKHLLMISKIMYTQLLEKIMENDKNLNIIIDKDSNSGLVYTNSDNKKEYVNMEYEKIIEKSMYKINKHLTDIYNDMKNNFDNLYYLEEHHKKNISEKYRNFRLNKDIKKTVETYFGDILNKNHDKSIKIMKEINENDIIDNNVIGF